MANEEYTAEDALAREIQELRPYILRQQRAESVRPDPSFASALRARLTGAPAAVPVLERLRRVIATLVPPAPQPRLALAGVRSVGNAPQPVTYTAEDLQITISSERTAGGALALRGMIFSEAPEAEELSGAKVEILIAEMPQAEAIVDPFGAFSLEIAVAGEYGMQITLPDRVVIIHALAVSA